MANEDIAKLKIEKQQLPARSKRRRNFIVSALIAAAVILIILFSKGLLAPTVEVEVATVGRVYPSQGFTSLNASGYVVAQRKASVASKITGRLISIEVEEGSRVREGEVIARLEHEDAASAREQAKAKLDIAKADIDNAAAELYEAEIDFNRHKELLGEGLVRKSVYDAAESRYKKAAAAVKAADASVKAGEAALRGADASLGYTYIRAPFNAVVLTKNADIGDIITPLGAAANAKAAVVTVADMDSLQVETDVSESNLDKVSRGQPCEIQLDAVPGARFRGEVHMIVPTADRAKATVLVKVKLLDRDSRILPEMSAKVAFLERRLNPEDMTPRTVVSGESIIIVNGKKTVFIVKDDHAHETAVTTGQRIGDLTEVTGGLQAGDRVVLRPSGRLTDGAAVKIVEK